MDYGQFCTVARGAEVFGELWTPLVVRELLCGSRRFNDIRRGVPRMSATLLTQRLRKLESLGVIERRRGPAGWEYHPTAAGEELRPIVDALGHWARKWIDRDYSSYELDPAVLMWTLRRHVLPARFPPGRSVLHFRLDGAPPRRRYWWIVVQHHEEVDVCITDPGHPVTLTVTAKPRTLVDLLLEDSQLREVLQRKLLLVEGERTLARRFATLFDFKGGSGSFTGHPRHEERIAAGQQVGPE
jgi:DNA-binding HxlR family transcriptional regulator